MHLKNTIRQDGQPIVAARRPAWISRLAKQLVIVVRDVTGSMKGQKAKDAQAACNALVAELAIDANKDGFLVGVVDFSESATVVHQPTPATKLSGHITPLSVDGWTNITSGLDAALHLLESFRGDANITYLKPVILIFSDGGHNHGDQPYDTARRITATADLVSVAFGSDADEILLRRIASSPQHFYRVKDGRELRGFMATVGATLTVTMAQGRNATQALANLPQ